MAEKIKQVSLLLVKLIVGVIIVTLTAGYVYTFYKEYVHSFTIPDTVKRVTGTEGDITYLSYGEAKNQPIVLLHGTGANAFIWEMI